MKVGIQGERGSACDAAAVVILKESLAEVAFDYLIDAEGVLSALEMDQIDAGVLASESPLGVPVQETVEALKRHSEIIEISELQSEVRHCIMTADPEAGPIRKIASHPIPLQKHAEFLAERFPGYESIPMRDTGEAAGELASGRLSRDTAVIALPRAAEVFGLSIIERELPVNDNYLTRFVLVKRVTKQSVVADG